MEDSGGSDGTEWGAFAAPREKEEEIRKRQNIARLPMCYISCVIYLFLSGSGVRSRRRRGAGLEGGGGDRRTFRVWPYLLGTGNTYFQSKVDCVNPNRLNVMVDWSWMFRQARGFVLASVGRGNGRGRGGGEGGAVRYGWHVILNLPVIVKSVCSYYLLAGFLDVGKSRQHWGGREERKEGPLVFAVCLVHPLEVKKIVRFWSCRI